ADALAADPCYAPAHNNVGNLYKDRGDLPSAADSYRRAITAQPDFARAHFNLSDVITYTPDCDDFFRLRDQADRLETLSPQQARYIHFAMGKALNDVGAVDESFAHILAGNAIVRRLTNYEEAAALGQLENAA